MSSNDDVIKGLDNLISSLQKGRKSPEGSIDGYARSVQQEDRINELAYTVFGTPAGKEFLNYLRQITLNAPLGPDCTDNALRHREGMRYLFGIIHKRFEKGEDDVRSSRSSTGR